MILSVLYAKTGLRIRKKLIAGKRTNNMFCVINTELNDVIAMFLMKSDATDFIYKCRNPYGRKDYKVEYRKEYASIPLSIDENDNVTL
tara:strand:- start:475 stop:738 length:264 start_codon:yes stop_codon:yes gene_type:complete